MKFINASVSALFLGLTATAAQAAYTCDVHSYGNGLSATRGGHTRQMEIIKSWIPGQFTVDPSALHFSGWDPIEVHSYTDQKIRATVKIEDEDGRDHNLVYEVIIKENESERTIRALVTMRERRYKPLGPVVFYCAET